MTSDLGRVPVSVNAIISCYEGVVASYEETSRPRPEVEEVLAELSKNVPVAIVTSESYSFIRPRTERFAWAWACLNGLEVITRDDRVRYLPCGCEIYEREPKVKEVLNIARETFGSDEVLIVERWSGATLVGLRIDWRKGVDARKLNVIVREATSRGLRVVEYRQRPYVDILSSGLDRGHAVRMLKSVLGLEEPVMYLGDSESDNPAFREVEVPVAVMHELNRDERLNARYKIHVSELPILLRRVLESVKSSKHGVSSLRPQTAA